MRMIVDHATALKDLAQSSDKWRSYVEMSIIVDDSRLGHGSLQA